MLIGILSFVLGAVVATVGWGIYGYIVEVRMQLKEAAALSKLHQEEMLKQQQEKQQQAEQIGKMLAEAIKRRQGALPKPPPITESSATSSSVKERLKKAIELSAKQNKIDVRKGAEFQLQYNELELAKLAVLKAILADGFDPTITIRFNTGDTEMLLSKYVASIQKGLT